MYNQFNGKIPLDFHLLVMLR